MDDDRRKALELAMMARDIMDSFVQCSEERLFLEFVEDELFGLDGMVDCPETDMDLRQPNGDFTRRASSRQSP